MPDLTLADFERDALATLNRYCEIPALSPMFDEAWRSTGYLHEAARLIEAWARQRTFASCDVRVHELDGLTPMLVVTVEATGPGEGTSVLYGHLDKQPPLGEWSEGLDPFVAVRRGDRVFARGVADDGYSAFSALLALESLEASGIPHSRCVVLIEASEESGSSDLDAYLDAFVDHLGKVEVMICLDSGALTYDRLWVTNSLRGLINMEVTVGVLERALHSGAASGVVPSSFRVLRQLLDRIEDSATGEILLPELHAEIPAEHVASAKAIASEFGDIVAEEFPVLKGVTLMGDGAEDHVLRRNWSPALSVIGMGGIPDPAIAGNVLRTSTTTVISIRLPPTVSSTAAAERVTEVLMADPPSGATVTVETQSYADGWVTAPLAPWLGAALETASRETFGHVPGFAGEGGSIPFLASLGRRYPGVQIVATGVLGPDSNAHGIDEMLDLPTTVAVTNAVAKILAAHQEHNARS